MGNESFVMTPKTTPNGVEFSLQGRIDSMNAAEFGYKLDQAISDGQTNIVLNMLRVEYLSSIGIRVILKAYKEAKAAGGVLEIEMPSESVVNVLGMVALNEMLVKRTPQ